jgi:fructose-bisphosphate aldolase class II
MSLFTSLFGLTTKKSVPALRNTIAEYQSAKKAIGHFNISNLEGFHAIIESSEELKLPVVIGVSEGEEDFVGMHEAVALVRSAQARGIQVYLNADHHYSLERVRACLDAGFDMAIADGAKLSIEENIKLTKSCVEYARELNSETGRDVLIEAELGYIGQSSKVYDTLPIDVVESSMTTAAEAYNFVTATGVDLLAPAVGNVHGIIADGEPPLHPEVVWNISQQVKIPLVLHGASGNSDADIRNCIASGVVMVHVNTELRVAYTNALRQALAVAPTESAPYKYCKQAREAMKSVIQAKMKLFAGLE